MSILANHGMLKCPHPLPPSPTLSHHLLQQGGEGWSGQGEEVWGEDIQVYVFALHSPLPVLTIPPYWLTAYPANHHCQHYLSDNTLALGSSSGSSSGSTNTSQTSLQ